jgi:hypothetical protein
VILQKNIHVSFSYISKIIKAYDKKVRLQIKKEEKNNQKNNNKKAIPK